MSVLFFLVISTCSQLSYANGYHLPANDEVFVTDSNALEFRKFSDQSMVINNKSGRTLTLILLYLTNFAAGYTESQAFMELPSIIHPGNEYLVNVTKNGNVCKSSDASLQPFRIVFTMDGQNKTTELKQENVHPVDHNINSADILQALDLQPAPLEKEGQYPYNNGSPDASAITLIVVPNVEKIDNDDKKNAAAAVDQESGTQVLVIGIIAATASTSSKTISKDLAKDWVQKSVGLLCIYLKIDQTISVKAVETIKLLIAILPGNLLAHSNYFAVDVPIKEYTKSNFWFLNQVIDSVIKPIASDLFNPNKLTEKIQKNPAINRWQFYGKSSACDLAASIGKDKVIELLTWFCANWFCTPMLVNHKELLGAVIKTPIKVFCLSHTGLAELSSMPFELLFEGSIGYNADEIRSGKQSQDDVWAREFNEQLYNNQR